MAYVLLTHLALAPILSQCKLHASMVDLVCLLNCHGYALVCIPDVNCPCALHGRVLACHREHVWVMWERTTHLMYASAKRPACETAQAVVSGLSQVLLSRQVAFSRCAFPSRKEGQGTATSLQELLIIRLQELLHGRMQLLL